MSKKANGITVEAKEIGSMLSDLYYWTMQGSYRFDRDDIEDRMPAGSRLDMCQFTPFNVWFSVNGRSYKLAFVDHKIEVVNR